MVVDFAGVTVAGGGSATQEAQASVPAPACEGWFTGISQFYCCLAPRPAPRRMVGWLVVGVLRYTPLVREMCATKRPLEPHFTYPLPRGTIRSRMGAVAHLR